MAYINPLRLVRAYLSHIAADDQDDHGVDRAYRAGAATRRAEQPREVPAAHSRFGWAFFEGWDGADDMALDEAR